MNKILLFVSIMAFTAFLSIGAVAADDIANRDANRVTSMLGSNVSDEVRNVLTDDDGKLILSEIATVTYVANLASGTVTINDGSETALIDASGNLMVNVSTGTISSITTITSLASGTMYIESDTGLEYEYTSPATSSVATMTFSAPVSTLCIYNTGANYVTVVRAPATHGQASATNGFPVSAGGFHCFEKIWATEVSLYNFDSGAAANVFGEGRRR
jgi:hypothetical protein